MSLGHSWNAIPFDSQHVGKAGHQVMNHPDADAFIGSFDTEDTCRNDDGKTNLSLREQDVWELVLCSSLSFKSVRLKMNPNSEAGFKVLYEQHASVS